MIKIEEKTDWPIIGNNAIINFLKGNIHYNKIAQAYLFYGPQQIGKRTTANIFAKIILCQNSKNEHLFCGSCTACKQFEKGIHPEFLVLSKEKDKKNITIETVRSFQYNLNTTSFLGEARIGIIDDAANLSIEGANALLKTLEEPAGKSIIILITQSLDSLPATVISRCQLLAFNPVARSNISFYLEQLGCSNKNAQKISALSCGRPGRAIDFFKHPSLLQKYEATLDDFFRILRNGILDRFVIAQELFNIKNYQERIERTEAIINIWLLVIRDIILIKENRENRIIHISWNEQLKKFAKITTLENLLQNFKELFMFKESLNKNVNPQLALENYFLNLKSYA